MMTPYLDILDSLQLKGHSRQPRGDRTGTGTYSIFGPQIEFDLQEGFPAVTTKELFFSSVKKELLWMLRGETNVNDLDCGIWDEWADEDGDLGPVYGSQWRSWNVSHIPDDAREWLPDRTRSEVELEVIDQIEELVLGLRHNPYSRRHIVSAWNVGELHEMALPPCHILFHFYVREDQYLDCKLYQRSADWFLGVPFNIASYATLTHLIAEVTGYEPGRFIHTFGDAHLYANHLGAAKEQLSRDPYDPPELSIPEIDSLDELESLDPDAITLENYEHHPHISAEISV